MAQRELRQIYPQLGWVEHDPKEIWASQLATANEALAQARIASTAQKGPVLLSLRIMFTSMVLLFFGFRRRRFDLLHPIESSRKASPSRVFLATSSDQLQSNTISRYSATKNYSQNRLFRSRHRPVT